MEGDLLMLTLYQSGVQIARGELMVHRGAIGWADRPLPLPRGLIGGAGGTRAMGRGPTTAPKIF